MSDVIVWSGWVGGVAVGLYALAQLVLTGKVLGVSTGYGNVCALVSNRAYFRKGPYADRMSWRLLFLVGLPLGGLIAGLTSTGSARHSADLPGAADALVEGDEPSADAARDLVQVGRILDLHALLAVGHEASLHDRRRHPRVLEDPERGLVHTAPARCGRTGHVLGDGGGQLSAVRLGLVHHRVLHHRLHRGRAVARSSPRSPPSGRPTEASHAPSAPRVSWPAAEPSAATTPRGP